MEPTSQRPESRDFQVVVDCHDPAAMAALWAEALGYESERPPGGHDDWMAYQIAQGFHDAERVELAAITDPRGHGRLCFMGVPEPKQSKNRLHLDIRATERADEPAEKVRKVDALVARLCAAGGAATRTGRERVQYYVVMADIEGLGARRRITVLVLGWGLCAAGSGLVSTPYLTGGLKDLTGDYRAGMLVLAGVMLLAAAAALGVGRTPSFGRAGTTRPPVDRPDETAPGFSAFRSMPAAPGYESLGA